MLRENVRPDLMVDLLKATVPVLPAQSCNSQSLVRQNRRTSSGLSRRKPPVNLTGVDLANAARKRIFLLHDNQSTTEPVMPMAIWHGKNRGRMAESGLRHRF